MPDERSEDLERLFHAALDREPEERAAFLETACSDSPGLKDRVEALLAADRRASDFLARPAWSLPAGSSAPEAGSAGGAAEPGSPIEQLGAFRLVRRLGEGGMGIVYEAEQEPLGRRVALKIIRPERVGSPEMRARFWREAEAVAELRHPNIVTVFGAGEEQGVCYFAMELLEGRGLDEILRDAAIREKVPLAEMLRWFAEIAEALDHAHRAGIIHRDVKPSNILIAADGRAMLMDFGIARHDARASLTITGDFRGTPHYASPEQVRAERGAIDGRTDVYSLGVTLYEARVGRVPFEGETTEQVFMKILELDPVPPRRLNRSISRDQETVIGKAMERDRRRRYESMAELAEDLRQLLAGEPVAARPPGRIRRSARWLRRHRRTSAGAATALLIGLGALTLALGAHWREGRIEAAERRFEPIREALGFPSRTFRHATWKWAIAADPTDPSSYMIRAVLAIDAGELEEASGALEACLASCGPSGEVELEAEANYLLGLVRLALADRAIDETERAQLLGSARSTLAQAGEFDPLSPETLVWRSVLRASIEADRAASYLLQTELNSEHHITHLYRGLEIAVDLHRGGESSRFEKAIDHFDKVLDARPENRVSLLYCGRTYYFLAKFYGLLDLTEEAESLLQRGLSAYGEDPQHTALNTLGAVCLLRGENEQALEWNERALAAARNQDQLHTHNILAGIGKAQARLGRLDAATAAYLEAHRMTPHDANINLVLAELALRSGRLEEALQYAEQSVTVYAPPPLTGSAAAHVLMACVYLRRGEEARASELLLDIPRKTYFSPRHQGQACLLAAALPGSVFQDTQRRLPRLEATILTSMSSIAQRSHFKERTAPIHWSIMGAHAWLLGEHRAAIDSFERAIIAREAWPGSAREYFWSEDARDRYFLAIAHQALSTDSPEHAERARNHFAAAESEYLEKEPPLEDADLISVVRAKAREVLERDR